MLKSFQKFSAVDRLFALLRVMVIIGGSLWMMLTPLSPRHAYFLTLNFIFFCLYSLILYLIIFRIPERIQQVYTIALFLDLIFLFNLVRFTGGHESEFFLAFLLLVALHSFYFGLNFGLVVSLLSMVTFLAAGGVPKSLPELTNLGLRFGFLLMVSISMGLLSLKEKQDRERIEQLHRELQEKHRELELERNKLAQILTGIGASLILFDKNKRIQWVNRVSEEWFGPAEQLIGKDCQRVLWKEEAICRECPTEKVMASRQIEVSEIEVPREDGSMAYYRITAAPLMNETGEVDTILELIQDVTEEREMQLHLIQASKMAAVGELASGVAHEINNPLGAIGVCVEEIAEEIQSLNLSSEQLSEIENSLQTIREEIQRCKRITKGLLEIARHQERRRQPLDINQIVRNVVLLVRYKIDREHKTLELRLADDLPYFMGEPDALAQVILNLVLNAIEFTPAGRRIEIATGKENSKFLWIKVSDEGCGIPPQNLSKIFKPYFSTKPPGMGTGLGLPISLRIVRNHGGDILVESQPNRGSTFTVKLPIQEI